MAIGIQGEDQGEWHCHPKTLVVCGKEVTFTDEGKAEKLYKAYSIILPERAMQTNILFFSHFFIFRVCLCARVLTCYPVSI